MKLLCRCLFPALLLFLQGCSKPALIPDTNPLFPDRQLEQKSEQLDQHIQQNETILRDKLARYVSRVGQNLLEANDLGDSGYTFRVIDDPVVNAFALPRKYVYIHRGLVTHLHSEAQLAAVLAHELAHSVARHTDQQLTGQTLNELLAKVTVASTGSTIVGSVLTIVGGLGLKSYSREHELEADRLGIEYLRSAGYTPGAMKELMVVLADNHRYQKEQNGKGDRSWWSGLLASHPETEERILQAENLTQADSHGIARQTSFMQALDGTTWGESPSGGLRYGNHFYHKELNFSLAIPERWRVRNEPAKLKMRDMDSNLEMELVLLTRQKDKNPEQHLLEAAGKEASISSLEHFTNSGWMGVSANIYRTKQGLVLKMGVVDNAQLIILLAGVNLNQAMSEQDLDQFQAIIRSISELDSTGKKRARGMVLKTRRVTTLIDWASLAEQNPLIDAKELMLINGVYGKPDHKPDGYIKTVHWAE